MRVNLTLPGRRTELSGDEEEYLPLQWAADSGAVGHRLASAGWRVAPAWSAQTALLPVLPKLAQGESAELAFEKFDPRRPMNRLVLRLWRSRYRLTTGRMAGNPPGKPIWYGALYQETFQQPWHLITLGATDWPDASAIPQLLPAAMPMLSPSAIEDGSVRHAVLVLPTAPDAPPH